MRTDLSERLAENNGNENKEQFLDLLALLQGRRPRMVKSPMPLP